jgi:CDP-diacylglycerol--glycerol-3-phosphate 3-phosphatidyltransferase
VNTPNKLTLLRVALVPVFIFFLMADFVPWHNLFALIVFIGASLTDLFDGYLARKNGQVTTFGKFLDPLADKILVLSALICFIEMGYASSVAIVIIIAREFMVTSLRLVAVSSSGTVIAAGKLGKLKTVISMISIIAILAVSAFLEIFLLELPAGILLTGAHILIWITAAITVISGVEYMVKNWRCVGQMK